MTTKIFDSLENELLIKTIHEKHIKSFKINHENNAKKQNANFLIRLSKQKHKASVKKIYFSPNNDWSSFGINGVLKIESILKKLNVKDVTIKASLLDGLEVYFWTRCGYKPILNNKNKSYFLMQKRLSV
tara:strand:- start:204 stop:590 length:387 start_codon:yes stop_codon:yes gene_type:complete